MHLRGDEISTVHEVLYVYLVPEREVPDIVTVVGYRNDAVKAFNGLFIKLILRDPFIGIDNYLQGFLELVF